LVAAAFGIPAVIGALGAGAGAVIGAIANPKCSPQSPLVCGTKNGAKAGAVIGVLVAGLGGALMTLNPEKRWAGLTALGTSAAVMGGLRAAHHPWGMTLASA
jgi:hypothetical protein